jgi:tight adherence protein B
MVLSLTAALRAGLSLRQALELAARDTPPPLGPEVARCVADVALGAGWAEALERLRMRLPGEGLTLLAWALVVHGRTGGDLPSLCERLHELLNERRRLRAKLLAATAQGRLSAAVVMVVPLLLGASLQRLAPDYLTPLFHTTGGWALLLWAVAMNALGVILVWRLSTLRW